MKKHFLIFFCLLYLLPAVRGQTDSAATRLSLMQCVQFALDHQPVIKQSELDISITERMIKGRLADWYPQINLNYNLQHNFQLQSSSIGGNVVKLGVYNTSSIQFGLNQTIFNRDVLLASRTAGDVRTQAQQGLESNKINVVAEVSKAFYDLLLTKEQIILLEEDIVRLTGSLQTAYAQYEGGLVDKIDYKRATILLNNSRAQKKSYEEALNAKQSYLKALMNFPQDENLALQYDTSKMESEIYIDTLQSINFNNRVEYRLLQTQRRLEESNLRYYKWSFLPSLSAFADYNLNYFNNEFSKLYNNNYPTSYAGISLSFPIFQGTKRIQQIKQAELELKRMDYDFISLKNNISTQYQQALAAYKSNLNYFFMLKENKAIAEEVYNTIQLQYKAGIKTYLEVITAETDLRSAQVNFYNALYQVLSSRIDMEQALGLIEF